MLKLNKKAKAILLFATSIYILIMEMYLMVMGIAGIPLFGWDFNWATIIFVVSIGLFVPFVSYVQAYGKKDIDDDKS